MEDLESQPLPILRSICSQLDDEDLSRLIRTGSRRVRQVCSDILAQRRSEFERIGSRELYNIVRQLRKYYHIDDEVVSELQALGNDSNLIAFFLLPQPRNRQYLKDWLHHFEVERLDRPVQELLKLQTYQPDGDDPDDPVTATVNQIGGGWDEIKSKIAQVESSLNRIIRIIQRETNGFFPPQARKQIQHLIFQL